MAHIPNPYLTAPPEDRRGANYPASEPPRMRGSNKFGPRTREAKPDRQNRFLGPNFSGSWGGVGPWDHVGPWDYGFLSYAWVFSIRCLGFF